jgi:hypothetical protein
MIKKFHLIFLLMLSCSLYGNEAHRYVETKIPRENGRFHTFVKALELLKERGATIMVETGTARCGIANCQGDGCSTLIFTEWAKDHGAEFFSVDINPQFLANAARDLGDRLAFVQLLESDSVAFLENFQGPIDFLYLDSYDYEDHNPQPSQKHHLREIIAAYPKLTENSVVMIDDCNLPRGGKGLLVVDYLRRKGWRVLVDGYQVILVKDK